MMTTYIEFRCEAGKVVSPELTVQDEVDLHRISCGICEQLSQLAIVRDDQYRDFAVMSDARVSDLQRHPNRDWPLEISGDAIATYNHKHSEKDAS